MTAKALAYLAAAIVGCLLLCSGLVGALVLGGNGSAMGCFGVPATVTPSSGPSTTPGPASTPSPTRPPLTVPPWDGEQTAHATTIINVGLRMKVPPRGWVIALATSMQESGLRNLGDLGTANDHDSLGLFQQRPSMGWGTPAQIMDPTYAATKFYERLLKIDRWQDLPLTVAAQKVQVSAYPDAYARHEGAAATLVTALTGMAGALGACGGEVGPQGWAAPVNDPVVSGFGMRDGAFHAGVDLGSPKGTPIHAAAAGTVAVATCNAPANWGCDRDGSTSITGCGWYVDIDHGAGISTRYCHMIARPAVSVGQRVTAGQIIGATGNSGNSSGPHLHLEIHLGGDTSNSGATDPVAYFAAHGASLGGR
ncbi:M23 family metallopeptidase [Longispora urticae]